MSRVVAYARVSTDKQTVENQLFEIGNYLKRQDRSYDDVVVETVSGMRPVKERELGRLMDELTEGDTLIVSETSRISRRTNEILMTIQYFIDRGVEVIAVKQNFRFGNDIQSKVIAFAFGLASEIERDLISSRTREALQRRKAEGKVLGRPKGTTKPESRKLHGRADEVMAYLDKRVPKSVIARLMGVNRQTVQNFIDEENLVFRLRSQKLEEAMKAEGTWKGQS